MRMKIRLFYMAAVCFACRSEQPPQSVPAVTQSTKAIARDTVGLATEADSVLDSAREGSPDPMFTSRGDTVSDFDGVIIGVDSSGTYALEVYSLNGVRFARIKRAMGRTSDGYLTWSTRARSLFPFTDSTQAVVRGCQIGGRENPFVFGVAAIYAQVPDWHPTRTWRFDPQTETISEVPAAGATCARMLREE